MSEKIEWSGNVTDRKKHLGVVGQPRRSLQVCSTTRYTWQRPPFLKDTKMNHFEPTWRLSSKWKHIKILSNSVSKNITADCFVHLIWNKIFYIPHGLFEVRSICPSCLALEPTSKLPREMRNCRYSGSWWNDRRMFFSLEKEAKVPENGIPKNAKCWRSWILKMLNPLKCADVPRKLEVRIQEKRSKTAKKKKKKNMGSTRLKPIQASDLLRPLRTVRSFHVPGRGTGFLLSGHKSLMIQKANHFLMGNSDRFSSSPP